MRELEFVADRGDGLVFRVSLPADYDDVEWLRAQLEGARSRQADLEHQLWALKREHQQLQQEFRHAIREEPVMELVEAARAVLCKFGDEYEGRLRPLEEALKLFEDVP